MSRLWKRSLIVLCAFLAFSPAFPAQDKTELVEKSFRMDGTSQAVLDFHDVDGRLILTSSPDSTISVRIRKELKGRDSKRAERLLRDTKVEIDQRGNTVTVRIRYPRFRGLFFWMSNRSQVKVTSEIAVPAGAKVKADLVDGSVRGDTLQGDIEVDVVDGDVQLDSLKGTVRVDSTDGDTQVSGEIKGLDLKSIDGNIRADLAPGSAMSGDWKIKTTDGDIDILLPEGFAAEMQIRKSDGRLRTDWPLTTPKGLSKRNIEGVIGAGGRVFSIRTIDGDVTLRKR